ncbi:hypothetical protein L2E82_35439 [Cichorium intybus]|uniref:Uncharacterized protein n=1 Tax=Cichorium intybus TaxID=13427 RepID=A0ACB9BP17_CICIN|nr:hypothetical protein L2E82_35439 [Cichorium intybus]
MSRPITCPYIYFDLTPLRFKLMVTKYHLVKEDSTELLAIMVGINSPPRGPFLASRFIRGHTPRGVLVSNYEGNVPMEDFRVDSVAKMIDYDENYSSDSNSLNPHDSYDSNFNQGDVGPFPDGQKDNNVGSCEDRLIRKRHSTDIYLLVLSNDERYDPSKRVGGIIILTLPYFRMASRPSFFDNFMHLGITEYLLRLNWNQLHNLTKMNFVKTLASVVEVKSQYEDCGGIGHENNDL